MSPHLSAVFGRKLRPSASRSAEATLARRARPLLLAVLLTAAAPLAQAQYTLLVSEATNGEGGSSNSNSPRLSADGRVVAFVSLASDLVPSDTNGVTDVFAWDRLSGQTTRVSVSTAGVQANSFCSTPSISEDGRFIVFASSANNLVTGDTNGVADIFRHDRVSGITLRVSTNAVGAQANGPSSMPWVSASGRYVAFASSATDLIAVDTNGVQDIFVKDMVTGLVTLESVSAGGQQANATCLRPVLSADARKVAFHSAASTLTPADTNGLDDVFVRDRLTGIVLRVSTGPLGLLADGPSHNPSLSADGALVAFESDATNLSASDTNGLRDVYLFDFNSGLCSQVAQTSNGRDPSLSGDGLRLAFTTDVALHPLDNNGKEDVYLKLLSGGVARLNLSSEGVQGNGASGLGSLDNEGRHAAFVSMANNIVAASTSGQQAYLRDTASAWTDLGLGMVGSLGVPQLIGLGTLLPSSPTSLSLSDAQPSAPSYILLGLINLSVPFKFGTLVPSLDLVMPLMTTGAGSWSVPFNWPAEDWSGLVLYCQAWVQDPGGPVGWSASNGLQLNVP